MKRILFPALTLLILVGCGTTANIENSWHDPEAQVDMNKLNKVLVVALVKNETHRRAAETRFALLLKGKGVASYQYFSGDFDIDDEETIKTKLKKEGFDGAVIMRLADVEKDIKYTPGAAAYPAYYNRFWPYFSNSWGYYNQAGHFETTKKFTIETNVYSLRKDKLIWSGLTSTSDPASAEKLMKAVAKEVHARMKKDGFIIAE
ncbi:MAG TPA: hypothetical protein VHM26_06285 [Chitinophagaceae bacterium]|jgi:hypothetical protein|nr:hypothetical protein [Chitinophagaceae bacterium]